ncbi:hypothetical protein PMI09_02311 [Rhizobium sp. CF122]|uniref:hypothetical protein n=1 Tax=Rhizobium sp. CF122 TaxID=1144312 RepID=UPI000271642C|nr:hypothetical protein [Rhizobium sp. CF122]EJL54570.1 hypothetical protein PMI09_02311 [Rhizobium sp. CF122]
MSTSNDFDPSDVYYHLLELGGLLETICNVLGDMEYARQDDSRIDELDQVYRLSRIAYREAERITSSAAFLDRSSVTGEIKALLGEGAQ